MGSRIQFASFSQLRQTSQDTRLQRQDVESLFERYTPNDTGEEDDQLSDKSEEVTSNNAGVPSSPFSDLDNMDANEALFDHLEIQNPAPRRWTHMGSRFDTPEMNLSRVAPLDYCDDEKLLFQVIETLSEKKMRYLIHQICRDQASAFRWFSRECLDMECDWPLMKLRVGLRRSTADENENQWWHNEFWERRWHGGRKLREGGEDRDEIPSPWIMDPCLLNPCPTCMPHVLEEIEGTQNHGKARGKSKASTSSHAVLEMEHETFTCLQCGEEITADERTEDCVFHPPTARQPYQSTSDDETIEEAIQRQDRDAALERLGVLEQESWGLTWSCCGESGLSPGCERARHAPERLLKYNEAMFYGKASPTQWKRLGRRGIESSSSHCGSTCGCSEDDNSNCESIRRQDSSVKRDGKDEASPTSVVTVIQTTDNSLVGSEGQESKEN